MKKKLILFTAAFLAFYMVAILTRQLPGLVHGKLGLITDSHSRKEWIQFTGDIICIYLLSLGVYLVFHQYYPKGKYVTLTIWTVLITIVMFWATFWWTGYMEGISLRLSNFFRQNIIPETLAVLFAVFLFLIRYTHHKELQQAELVLQSRQTELSFLRSQINPHFLFNNLNNIYSLVAYKSDLALPAIAQLSDLLRYMLYDSNERVSLSQELNYIDKYIALQQLRYEFPSPISYNISGETNNRFLSPLLLIPFIENAFKHGKVLKDREWLTININADPEHINFTCTNIVQKNKRTDSVGGIGISNVRKRLLLLYPNEKHRLTINEVRDLFTVTLDLYDSK